MGARRHTWLGEMVTADPAMRGVFERVPRVALSAEPVLVLGETGTGKEGVARALHLLSRRGGGPFEAVNCGALHGDMATSELLGHERGAFTGAERRHAGVFERADGGTVFLDEIGELCPAVQARLLRVLETRRVRPMGACREQPRDFRLVCATHRDLPSEVAAGRFREDLYYRLGVVVLRLPPLRARPGDVALLAARFLEEVAPERAFSADALSLLARHAWPGNVRELRNAVRRVAVEGDAPLVEAAELRALWHRDQPSSPTPAAVAPEAAGVPVGGRTLHEVCQDVIRYEVACQRGNVARAARVLGVARSTVYGALGEARRAVGAPRSPAFAR